jgi:hypothetical protein
MSSGAPLSLPVGLGMYGTVLRIAELLSFLISHISFRGAQPKPVDEDGGPGSVGASQLSFHGGGTYQSTLISRRRPRVRGRRRRRRRGLCRAARPARYLSRWPVGAAAAAGGRCMLASTPHPLCPSGQRPPRGRGTYNAWLIRGSSVG